MYYGNVLSQEPTRDLIVAVDSSSTPQKFTVSEFNKQVTGYAVGMLESLGLKKGYKVGLWMTGELEHVVLRLAAGLLGVEVVCIDPAVGFEGVKSLIACEGLHALILSPRFAGQDRHGALRKEFHEELASNATGMATGTHGIFPLESKRFRSLKYLVCSSTEYADAVGTLYGVVRMNNLVTYGPCAYCVWAVHVARNQLRVRLQKMLFSHLPTHTRARAHIQTHPLLPQMNMMS